MNDDPIIEVMVPIKYRLSSMRRWKDDPTIPAERRAVYAEVVAREDAKKNPPGLQYVIENTPVSSKVINTETGWPATYFRRSDYPDDYYQLAEWECARLNGEDVTPTPNGHWEYWNHNDMWSRFSESRDKYRRWVGDPKPIPEADQ